jgi:hypothetical protein
MSKSGMLKSIGKLGYSIEFSGAYGYVSVHDPTVLCI